MKKKFIFKIIILILIIFVSLYFDLFKLKIISDYKVIENKDGSCFIFTKDELIKKMKYHGVNYIYCKNGNWYFKRNSNECKLK